MFSPSLQLQQTVNAMAAKLTAWFYHQMSLGNFEYQDCLAVNSRDSSHTLSLFSPGVQSSYIFFITESIIYNTGNWIFQLRVRSSPLHKNLSILTRICRCYKITQTWFAKSSLVQFETYWKKNSDNISETQITY